MIKRRHDHAQGSVWETVNVPEWNRTSVRALLACLLICGRRVGREYVMDRLWPDLSVEQAAGRLDQAVHRLRCVLGDPALLHTSLDMLELAPQQVIWADADAFIAALASINRHIGGDGDEQRLLLLEEALALYQGTLLSCDLVGYERREEVQALRESLQRSWIGGQLALADARLEIAYQQPVVSALALLAGGEPLYQVLSIDPTNEAALKRLMQILLISGRRGEALQRYETLADHFHRRYQARPLAHLYRLYRRIGTGHHTTLQQGAHTALGQEAVSSLSSPLVLGRERERACLLSCLRSLEHAHLWLPDKMRLVSVRGRPSTLPQSLVLLGERGIGKTSLAQSMTQEARERGWLTVWGRPSTPSKSLPYLLWIDLLSSLLAQMRDQRIEQWWYREVALRPSIFEPLCLLLPELLPSLDAPIRLRFHRAPLASEIEPIRLYDAISEILLIACRRAPLLLVIDDLHLADEASCELFAFLARHSRDMPLLLVATACPHHVAINHPLALLIPELRRYAHLGLLSLSPLDSRSIARLVTLRKAQAGHADLLPQEQDQPALVRLAAGNPLFAELLVEQSDVHDLVTLHARLSTPLPRTIATILDFCLARIGEACQRLLVRAAFLGEDRFSYASLFLLEQATSRLPEERILSLLEEALSAGLLFEAGYGGQIMYRFWHPLLAQHLRSSASAVRRAHLLQCMEGLGLDGQWAGQGQRDSQV
jgi:DNA-binding SARP family transcriptional activator